MKSTEMHELSELVRRKIVARAGSGGLDDKTNRELATLQASIETAFQLAKLNEAIESGATITIRPPDGRKFR